MAEEEVGLCCCLYQMVYLLTAVPVVSHSCPVSHQPPCWKLTQLMGEQWAWGRGLDSEAC